MTRNLTLMVQRSNESHIGFCHIFKKSKFKFTRCVVYCFYLNKKKLQRSVEYFGCSFHEYKTSINAFRDFVDFL